MTTYAILDVETTMRSKVLASSTPFAPNNVLVLGGLRIVTPDMRVSTHLFSELPGRAPHTVDDVLTVLKNFGVTVLVGHNLGFDLHWMFQRADPEFRKFLGTSLQIWDTQLAEFLLSGQRLRYPSLDECAFLRGGSLKDDKILDYWKGGVDTEDIPPEELRDYLLSDLENTCTVFRSQLVDASNENMLSWIWERMDCLAATTDMTFNGLVVDNLKLKAVKHDLTVRRDKQRSSLQDMLKAANLWPHWLPEFNPQSNAHVSTLLFGGDLRYTEREQVGYYKNGNPKYQTVEKTFSVPSMVPVPPGIERGASGHYSVDEKSLKAVLAKTTNINGATPVLSVVSSLLKLRELNKSLNTYVNAYETHQLPASVIHPDINHCVAVTGRLSSSSPNLQNVEDSEVKAVFVSRWGDDGELVEFDYEQLEVVGLALCSGDPFLIADLVGGVDVHSALFQDMYGVLPTKEERKRFKPLTFGLIYGAGVTTLAENAGVSTDVAKEFVQTFYRRYPRVPEWHTRMQEMAESEGSHLGAKDSDGVPVREFVWKSLTGHKYHFREYDAPEFLKRARNDKHLKSFSPTELKNYPVQGLATGDLVPMGVGALYRAIYRRGLEDVVKLVLTVHDSVLADVDKSRISRTEVARLFHKALTGVPKRFGELFGSWPAPGLELNVGMKAGPNWYDMKDINIKELL